MFPKLGYSARISRYRLGKLQPRPAGARRDPPSPSPEWALGPHGTIHETPFLFPPPSDDAVFIPITLDNNLSLMDPADRQAAEYTYCWTSVIKGQSMIRTIPQEASVSKTHVVNNYTVTRKKKPRIPRSFSHEADQPYDTLNRQVIIQDTNCKRVMRTSCPKKSEITIIKLEFHNSTWGILFANSLR